MERRIAIVRPQQPVGEDGVVRIPHVVGGLTVKQVTGSVQHPSISSIMKLDRPEDHRANLMAFVVPFATRARPLICFFASNGIRDSTLDRVIE